ncbi:MAG TPA: hypothetical protein VGD45_15025 [Steroidobacter sp.]|uniref:hypothetical protein n=1 Tax=Steroidobacter sp. TaxID=1978227 RepID=UPI002ED918AE
MGDNQTETRERFLAAWRARMNYHDMEDKQREIREHSLGNGVALGSGLGLAIGAGFGAALGNLAWGIGIGLSIGAGIGIALGAAQGDKHAKAVQEPSAIRGSRSV